MSFKGPSSLKMKLGLSFSRIPLIGRAPIARYLCRKYGERVVTPFKVKNFIQAQEDLLRKAVEVKSLPYILNLDTFSGCNLQCPFCATGANQQDRDQARMPLEHAKSVIDKVKRHVMEIRLFNWGEPFLNPDIFEIIRYAHDAGLYTIVNSNMSVHVEGLAQKIIDSKLDVLQASVDGVSQESLHLYRRKADAQLIFDNVKALAAERRRLGLKKPLIDMAFLVFRHNEHELEHLEAKRSELGADRFYPRRGFIYEKDWVPEHADFQPMQALFEGTCDYLYSEITVEASGAISPCCANTSTAWDVGKVEDIDTMESFWNGPVYKSMRTFYSDPGHFAEQSVGKPVLCQSCGFVNRDAECAGKLSPLPPAFQAQGKRYTLGAADRLVRRAS